MHIRHSHNGLFSSKCRNAPAAVVAIASLIETKTLSRIQLHACSVDAAMFQLTDTCFPWPSSCVAIGSTSPFLARPLNITKARHVLQCFSGRRALGGVDPPVS